MDFRLWLEKTEYCFGCGEPINEPMFMVNDDVWEDSAIPENAQVHLACLETHLQRKLTKNDFSQYANTVVNKCNSQVRRITGYQLTPQDVRLCNAMVAW